MNCNVLHLKFTSLHLSVTSLNIFLLSLDRKKKKKENKLKMLGFSVLLFFVVAFFGYITLEKH